MNDIQQSAGLIGAPQTPLRRMRFAMVPNNFATNNLRPQESWAIPLAQRPKSRARTASPLMKKRRNSTGGRAIIY